jgi:hypothetical protein
MASAVKLFEAELRKRKLTFDRRDDGLYVVSVGELKLEITLENVARDLARDRDPGRIVRFVDSICEMASPLPPWNVARGRVRWMAESVKVELGDSIRVPVSEHVVRVPVLESADESRLSMVTPSMLATWKVSEADVASAATKNQDRLLEGKELEIAEADDRRLGMVPVASALKASTIFAPGFKKFVAKLGWPVLVVIPCRDFIYVIAEADKELLGAMGRVVQQEFRTSGYPLTTEVFRISDDGIEAIGAFPE